MASTMEHINSARDLLRELKNVKTGVDRVAELELIEFDLKKALESIQADLENCYTDDGEIKKIEGE